MLFISQKFIFIKFYSKLGLKLYRALPCVMFPLTVPMTLFQAQYQKQNSKAVVSHCLLISHSVSQ